MTSYRPLRTGELPHQWDGMPMAPGMRVRRYKCSGCGREASTRDIETRISPACSRPVPASTAVLA